MYKDKDKQRAAAAERQRRYRDRQKALLSEGVTDKALHSITVSQESMVIPDDTPFTLPVDVRLRCTETNEKIIKHRAKGITKVLHNEGITERVLQANNTALRGCVTLQANSGVAAASPKPQSYNPMMVGYVPPKD